MDTSRYPSDVATFVCTGEKIIIIIMGVGQMQQNCTVKSKQCWHLQYYKEPLLSGVCDSNFLLSFNNVSLSVIVAPSHTCCKVRPVSWHSDVSFRRCQSPVAFRAFSTRTNICTVFFLLILLSSISVMQIYQDDWSFWNTRIPETDAERNEELPHSVSFGLLFFFFK